MQMRRQWMYGARVSDDFLKGMHEFLTVAEISKRKNGFMCCPCSLCKNKKDYPSSAKLHQHLLQNGFMRGYYCWTKHGETGVIMEENEEEEDNDNYPMFDEHGGTSMGEDEVEEDEKKDEPDDDLRQAIHDAQMDCGSENERLKLERMLADHTKLLYPTCTDGQKKLGTILEMLQWKAESGTTDKHFESLLKTIK